MSRPKKEMKLLKGSAASSWHEEKSKKKSMTKPPQGQTPPRSIDILYEFDEEKIRSEYINQKPYLLRGIGSQWPAMHWDFKNVRDEFGDTTVYAYEYDRSSSLSYLSQALLHRHRMTVSTFLDSYFQKDEAATWSLKECGEVFEEHPELYQDLDFSSVYAGPKGPDVERDTYFWIGNADSSIGLHADIAEFSNLFQIRGRKHWVFFPPGDKDYLYMETKDTVDGGLYSPLDVFEAIDLDKYPNFAKATRYDIIMEPGDILYVPSGWWHSVYSVTPTMSVNHIAGEAKSVFTTYSLGSYMEGLRFLTVTWTTQHSNNILLLAGLFLVVFVVAPIMKQRSAKMKGW